MKTIILSLGLLFTSLSANATKAVMEAVQTTNNALYVSSGNVYVQAGGTFTVKGNAFSVGGSTLIVSAGNVGIGQSPTSLFDVYSVSLATMVFTMGAPTAFTPTLSCGGGSLSSASSSGQYLRVGRVVYYNITTTITTVGSCTGTVIASLPFSHPRTCYLMGAEDVNTGKTVNGYITANSSQVVMAFYDNSSLATNGNRPIVSGMCITN